MDDLLITNLEDETAAVAEAKSCHSKSKKTKSPNKLNPKNGKTTAEQPETSAASELCPETIVTMYTSDVVSNEVRSFPGKQTSAGLYFSGASNAESNIKCILTTFLFLAVVAAIIIVAIFKNPGM